MAFENTNPNSKILLCITEDWFALSHFQPLIEVLSEISDRLIILTNVREGREALEALGAEVHAFDFSRASLNPVKQARAILKLARIIRAEQPDVVHFVSLQIMLAGAVALGMNRARRSVYHLTGAGFLVTSGSLAGRLLKPAVMRTIRSGLSRPRSQLFVENPDDADLMCGGQTPLLARTTIIPGAGVDPGTLPLMPQTGNTTPVISAVGRMLYSKGVMTLAEASRILHARGIDLAIRCYGATDDNPESIPKAELALWNGTNGLPEWCGRTSDIASVWRQSDICVMAPLVREGMPRAMLEAAS